MRLKLILLFAFCNLGYLIAQERPENVRLFIDCQTNCDLNYIKTEIPYLDFVNDRFQANVYILITSQQTGGGGRNYNLSVSGLGPFEGIRDTITYIQQAIATDSENRSQAVQAIKSGVLPFLLKTEKAKDVVITFKESEGRITNQQIQENDPWNFWVMNITASGAIEGENNYSSTNLSGGLSASHVSDKLKVNLRAGMEHETNRYGSGAGKFSFTNRNYNFNNTTVWSVSPKFSAGFSARVEQSDFRNLKLFASLSPAIEYNFYPYTQAQTQSVTLMYRIGPRYFKYYEETVYLQTKELRFQQNLSLEMRYNKPWGEISGSTSYSHYFHDFSKNRLSFFGNVELRVVKGLFFNLGGSYAFQRDQLNIIKGDVTDQDLLTRRRQLNSSFDFDMDFGIRYRFGSIYNSIVNPRF
jgi:hypothetical protein